jgi:hypothetical protein
LRKSTDNEITRPEYSTVTAEREYQKLVFNPEVFAAAVTAINGTSQEQDETCIPSSTDPTPIIDDLNEGMFSNLIFLLFSCFIFICFHL